MDGRMGEIPFPRHVLLLVRFLYDFCNARICRGVDSRLAGVPFAFCCNDQNGGEMRWVFFSRPFLLQDMQRVFFLFKKNLY